MKQLIAPLLLALVLCATADAAQRSSSAKREFRAHQRCPATQKYTGKCPGFQIDHIIPLCAGGPDEASNMQWLSVKDHKAKTKVDVRHCRAIRKGYS